MAYAGRWRAVALVLTLASVAAPGGVAAGAEEAEPPAPGDAGTPPPELHTVTGTISAVSWAERSVTIEGRHGKVTATFDRNTAVYSDARLASPRRLVVGASVRAEYGPEKRLYWVEVHGGGREPPDATSAKRP